MNIPKEKQRLFSSYLRVVERANVRKEYHKQQLEFIKDKPDKDHVIYKRDKLLRLIQLLDDKIEFYEDLMARL